MDAEQSSKQNWQAFACTGNIYCYLDYKKQAVPHTPQNATGEEPDGAVCDTGARTQRDPL